MADSYAIIGIGKVKTMGNLQGVLSHMTRSRRTPNSNGKPNDILIPPPPFKQIEERINSYMPRRNAIYCYDFLMTLSPEAAQKMTEKQIQAWEQDSLAWCKKVFGSDNLIPAITHRDEQTPHIQAIIIPEWQGRLCAAHYTDGRQKLRDLWTSYAQAMKPYGLKRGKLYSPAKHTSIKNYYADVNRAAELSGKKKFKAADLPEPGIKDYANPRAYAANLINFAIERYQQQNANLRTGLKAEQQEKEKLIAAIAKDRQLYAYLKENPDALRNLENALAEEKKGRAADKERLVKLLAAVKLFFRKNIDPRSTMRKPENLGHLLDFPEIAKDLRIDLKMDKKPTRGMTLTK